MVDTIMLFAAGLGTRMGHLTSNKPKSLVKIHDKPILHYALDFCKSYPFKRIVINTHYFPKAIEHSLEEYKRNNLNSLPEIITVFEEELLETGGAIKNAIETLGHEPIFTLNTDVILQTKQNIFSEMVNKWDSAKMDFLLLLHPIDKAVGYVGNGDFEVDNDGNLSRPHAAKYKFMYAGLTLLKPELIAQNSSSKFSLKDYYLKMYRVYGIQIKDAKWYHATRPEDVEEIEQKLFNE